MEPAGFAGAGAPADIDTLAGLWLSPVKVRPRPASELPNGTKITDGQFDFSGGVSTQRVPTIQSALTPNGLRRNQLAFCINGTVRDCGLTPRFGYLDLGKLHPGGSLFQGALLYEPTNNSKPYWIASIGGHVWIIDPDNPTAAQDISVTFNLFNPAGVEKAYLCQGEEFCVIQAGDLVTLPLFWDNTTLRRSNGLTGNTDPTLGPINEIPPAGPMSYYFGRLWYAQSRSWAAGDIVKGANGTKPYAFRDAILKVTENPLAIGGDGFAVPTQAGAIRALAYSANLDTALGQGNLYIFTRKQVYAMSVPVTRADWINATEPLVRVVQIGNGSTSDNSVLRVNGDLFYQSFEPAIRSLMVAVRYFGQWANPPISSEINRVVRANDRSLLHMSSAINFSERMYQTALPHRTPVGVAHKALAVMDFNPLGTLNEQLPPIWEGIHQDLAYIHLGTGDFGGRERAFSFALSQDGSIHLWELTDYSLFQQDDKRVTMICETPAFTWQKETECKRLIGGQLWVDRLYGRVLFKVEYRPDGETCWHVWQEWQECNARSSAEDWFDPIGYPATPYGEGYRQTMDLPEPQPECAPMSNRQTNIGYQFQLRITVKGWARIRGIILYAEEFKKGMYDQLVNARLNQVIVPGVQ